MSEEDAASARSTLGALGLVVVLVAGIALLPRVLRRREAGVGRQAPSFTLPLVANGAGVAPRGAPTLALDDLRGRAVLLDFWATWCEPCRIEGPILDRLARRWRDRGLVVVGVDTDAPGQGDPGAFAAHEGLTYPIVQDTAGEAARAYGIENLPTLVVVSRRGAVIGVRTGVTDDAELERLVRLGL